MLIRSCWHILLYRIEFHSDMTHNKVKLFESAIMNSFTRPEASTFHGLQHFMVCNISWSATFHGLQHFPTFLNHELRERNRSYPMDLTIDRKYFHSIYCLASERMVHSRPYYILGRPANRPAFGGTVPLF